MASNRKDVFVIQKNGSKSFWKKCGVAFVNNDNSVNVKLDLFPNVDLQIREPREKEEQTQE